MATKTRILITGAAGQLGENLVEYYKDDPSIVLITTDLHTPEYEYVLANKSLNVLDADAVLQLTKEFEVDQVYHLAALLSASGEKNPLGAWHVNMQGLLNVLEAARMNEFRVFWPSSIAVFGETTPKHMTPQKVITEPSTAYGISKVAGELWCEYYYKTYGLDVRSLRFPGLISWKGDPGGGTTDYAVDIFHQAIQNQHFVCFLQSDAYLPMLYMDDAIEGIATIMSADPEQIVHRDSYNISGMSFSPREIALEIQKHIPDFTIEYQPDFRQKIAESWPASIEDIDARAHWGWNPQYNLAKMTEEILFHLQNR